MGHNFVITVFGQWSDDTQMKNLLETIKWVMVFSLVFGQWSANKKEILDSIIIVVSLYSNFYACRPSAPYSFEWSNKEVKHGKKISIVKKHAYALSLTEYSVLVHC